jgi:prophage regulatory protein
MEEIDPILRRPEVLKLTGVSDSTLFRLCRLPVDPFPAPIRIGRRACGWRASSVRSWLDSRQAGPSSAKAPKTNQATPSPSSVLEI